MTDQWHNQSMIRQYVDGELSTEQTAEFERAMVERLDLQHAVEFERQLRRAVSSAMSTEAAPAALHDAVLRGLNEAEDAGDAVSIEAEAEAEAEAAVAGRIGGGGLLSSPIRANFFAVAASLALVVGAIMFGLWVPQIDNWSHQESMPVSQLEIPAYFSKEHCTSAAIGGRLDTAPAFEDVASATIGLSGLLDRSVTIFDLSDIGYEFSYAAPCKVCEADNRVTGRIMYKRTTPTGAIYASIFLVPVEYGVGTDTDTSDWESVATVEQCLTRVVRHRDDRFVYYLTACALRDFKMLEEHLLGIMKADDRSDGSR